MLPGGLGGVLGEREGAVDEGREAVQLCVWESPRGKDRVVGAEGGEDGIEVGHGRVVVGGRVGG